VRQVSDLPFSGPDDFRHRPTATAANSTDPAARRLEDR
jgi:hypothetical protein